jgi:hypothetical protein
MFDDGLDWGGGIGHDGGIETLLFNLFAQERAG